MSVVTTQRPPEPALPPLQMLAPVGALLLVIAVIMTGASQQTAWYVIRGTGIIAYVLVTLSVVVGLLMSNRLASPGRQRVDLYEVHAFVALLGLAFASVHGLSLLLDSFIGFSPVQLLVPFASTYRPFAVALGIVGFYLMAMVYGSLWLRRYIGYRAWRTLHYASFIAFVGASFHGILSGTDSSTLWMFAIYGVSMAAVAGLLVYRILDARDRRAGSEAAT